MEPNIRGRVYCRRTLKKYPNERNKHAMQHFTGFNTMFMEKIGFPQEARTCFNRVLKRLDDEKEYGFLFDEIRHEYLYPTAGDLGKALERLTALAEKMGMSAYTLHMVFLVTCAEVTLLRYRERGIDEAIFWETMKDFRYKLLECKECEGVWGTFVAGWNSGFFELNRFALGRFQFEKSDYNKKTVTLRGGYVLEKGARVIGFHIPSSGEPLTDEVRMASYKKAYDFYKDEFNGGPVVFGCGSWLLYKEHYSFLPKHLNILRFMDDFEILESSDSDDFGDAWRVFGRYADEKPEDLPTDTSLRRAFAERLKSGKPTGHGYGVIVFDGEKIINK